MLHKSCCKIYGVATTCRLLKIIGLFCKRALYKRWYSAKDTCNFKEPTNRSHPILQRRDFCVCIHVHLCHTHTSHVQCMEQRCMLIQTHPPPCPLHAHAYTHTHTRTHTHRHCRSWEREDTGENSQKSASKSFTYQT